ncbi:MAG: hypothetical protein ACODAB_01830 [Gemmatimonadota bacterium]
MGVVGFHRFLISAAILFCLGYGVYEIMRYDDGAGNGALVTAVVFAGLAAGLGYYLANLERFLHRNGG